MHDSHIHLISYQVFGLVHHGLEVRVTPSRIEGLAMSFSDSRCRGNLGNLVQRHGGQQHKISTKMSASRKEILYENKD